MKRYLFTILAFLFCHISPEAGAQCSKNCKNCKSKQTKQTMKDGNNTALSCKLTSPELRKRKEEVIGQLKKQVLERRELRDGYGYKFAGTDEILDQLTEFIKTERQCCGFFNFRLSVNNDSFTWLDITGPEGVKEFIEGELEM